MRTCFVCFADQYVDPDCGTRFFLQRVNFGGWCFNVTDLRLARQPEDVRPTESRASNVWPMFDINYVVVRDRCCGRT